MDSEDSDCALRFSRAVNLRRLQRKTRVEMRPRPLLDPFEALAGMHGACRRAQSFAAPPRVSLSCSPSPSLYSPRLQ